MIIRVRGRESGFAEYMRSGDKEDTEGEHRNEKDKVQPLHGDLDSFEAEENMLARSKWKEKTKYLSITASFSKEDMEKLSRFSPEKKRQILKEITQKIIGHYTAGYDPLEIEAYAEVHAPKRFVNETDDQQGIGANGTIKRDKHRYEHIHIAISKRNQLDGTQIQTIWHGNVSGNDILQRYLNLAYGFTNPMEHSRTNRKAPVTKKIALKRNEYIEATKGMRNMEDLYQFLSDQGVEWKWIETSKNKYIKIINPNRGDRGDRKAEQDLNLKGKGFEHIEALMMKEKRENQPQTTTPTQDEEQQPIYDPQSGVERKAYAKMDLDEIEKVLDTIYQNRKERINKRRSKKNTLKLEELKKSIATDEQELKNNLNEKLADPEFQKKAQEIEITETTQESIDLMLKSNGFFENDMERPKNEAEYTFQEIIDQQEVEYLSKHQEFIKISDGLDLNTLILYIQQRRGELCFDRFLIPTQDQIKEHGKQFIYRYKKGRSTPAKLSPMDLIKEQLNLSGKEAFEIMRKIYNQEISFDPKHIIEPIEMNIQTPSGKIRKIVVRNIKELEHILQKNGVSNIKTKYRKSRTAVHVESMGNVLFYRIENRKNTPQLSIIDAQRHFQRLGIAAHIMPLPTHQMDIAGHIADRYMLILPLSAKPDINFSKRIKLSPLMPENNEQEIQKAIQKLEICKEFQGIFSDQYQISKYLQTEDALKMLDFERCSETAKLVTVKKDIYISETIVTDNVKQAHNKIYGTPNDEESATPKSKSGIILKSGGFNPLQMN